MKLPFFKGIGQKEVKEYFLALLLRDESLRAVVFEEINGSIQIIGTGEQPIPTSLEALEQEKLLDLTDKAIGMAETALPNGIQTHKTIFGLMQNWVESTNIKKEKLTVLKALCEELNLQPIGFLVFSEAIAHLLQKQEGAPVSSVLAELGKENMTLTLLRAGRVIEVQKGPIEEPIAKAVDTLLQHFTNVEILPSRIVLLDSEKRPHLAKSFISHQWSKSLPFLHVPQITALESDFETQAILYGTASQMGFAMQQMPKSRIAPKPTPDIFAQEEEEPKEEEPAKEPLSEEEPEEPEKASNQIIEEKSGLDDSEAFGFVTDKDVLEEAPTHPHAMPPHHGDNFETKQDIEEDTFEEIPEDVKEEEEGINRSRGFGANATFLTEGVKNASAQLKKLKLESLGTTVTGLLGLFKPQRGNGAAANGFPLLLLIPLLFVLILGGLLWYIFGLKATVTLVVDPKVVDADQIVTFSSNNSTDLSQQVIGGSAVTVDETGSVSTDATGKKDVGDKAKGTVTIYNLSDNSKTYTAGTTITSSNNLKFTLDKDVTVASGSSDPINPVAGKQDVSVTAGDIGTEYNLPSGTKFTIGGNVSVAAKNDKAFSGGTKKSVTVISKNDIDKLVDDLTTKLQDKAKSDLAQKADSSKSILSVFLKTTLTDKKFSGQAGDEASSVSLDGTITYTGLAYAKSDMDQLGGQLLKDKIADGHISDKGITADVSDASVKNGDIKATVKVKAGLIPSIDTTAIQKQLAGKSFSQAQSALQNMEQLSEVRVALVPNLFFLPKTLPRLSSHITVKVESSE